MYSLILALAVGAEVPMSLPEDTDDVLFKSRQVVRNVNVVRNVRQVNVIRQVDVVRQVNVVRNVNVVSHGYVARAFVPHVAAYASYGYGAYAAPVYAAAYAPCYPAAPAPASAPVNINNQNGSPADLAAIRAQLEQLQGQMAAMNQALRAPK